MDSKNDAHFIKQAIKEIDAIISYTNSLSYIDFMNDARTIDVSMFRLQ